MGTGGTKYKVASEEALAAAPQQDTKLVARRALNKVAATKKVAAMKKAAATSARSPHARGFDSETSDLSTVAKTAAVAKAETDATEEAEIALKSTVCAGAPVDSDEARSSSQTTMAEDDPSNAKPSEPQVSTTASAYERPTVKGEAHMQQKSDESDPDREPKLADAYWAVSLGNFESEAKEELSLAKGETVVIIGAEKKGWLRAMKHDEYGFVPSTWVKPQTELMPAVVTASFEGRDGTRNEIPVDVGEVCMFLRW